MTNGKIQIHERTKTDHKVEIDAGPHRRANTVEHITVGDILKFAKALEEAEADDWLKVQAQMVTRDSNLIKHMSVQWSEDITNGQPTPQVEAEPEPKAHPRAKEESKDKDLGPITGRLG